MSSKAQEQDLSVGAQVPHKRRAPPPAPPKPRKFTQLSPSVRPAPRPAVRSTFLINDIPPGTTGVQLFNSIISPPHWKAGEDSTPAPAGQLQPQVQFSCDITKSRLDDELSVAILELTNTPSWLQQADLDPYGFPKKTKLGTLWRGIDMVKRDAEGQTEFMRAAISDDLIYAETLAEFEVTDVNVQDSLNRTALHWACEKCLPSIVMLCLSVPGCDVSLRDHDNLTAFDIAMTKKDDLIPTMFYTSILELEQRDPQEALLRILTVTSEPAAAHKVVFPGEALFQPIEERNPALVEALIARGVDLTARNADGNTALHVAVSMVDNVDMAQTLLAAGSDIDASGGGGATALHHAVGTGDEEMIKALLQWKPDLAIKDVTEKTAFDVAVQDGKHDISRCLLDHGADLIAIENSRLPVHPPEVGPGIDMVRVVPEEREIDLRTLADIKLQYGHQSTAIHEAAKSGDSVAVLLLLEHGARGANIDALDERRWTALHRAAGNGHTETVTVLLANGANIEALDKDHETALHWAAQNGHTETVTRLLANGANIEALDKDRWTALHYAAWNRRTETVTVLLANGANIEAQDGSRYTALRFASLHGRTETVTVLLANGAKINALDKDHETALHYAAWRGHAETVTVLLANGANIEAQDKDRWTGLHRAARCGHTKTVTELLANGANIEAQNRDRWTALHLAAGAGQTKTVTELLANRANIEAVADHKRTPLHFAIAGQYITTVAALLNAGANIEARSDVGTPVQRALKRRSSEMIDLLVAHGAQVTTGERLRHTLLHPRGWKSRAKRGEPTTDPVTLESGSKSDGR